MIFLLLGTKAPDLFDSVDSLCVQNKIQGYYCSPEFKVLKKKFSLWSRDSEFERSLPRFPCGEEIVKEIELYIMKHVTNNQISVDAIVLTDWVLDQFYPNSKQ